MNTRPSHLFSSILLLCSALCVLGHWASAQTPPNILLRYAVPKDQSVSIGGEAKFNVIATGSKPLHHLWHRELTSIAGETNSVLSITNAQPVDAGEYFAVVTNPAGSATSRVATLEVDPTFTKVTSGQIVEERGNFKPAAWGDFDQDGDLDVFVGRLGARSLLFQNNGDETFDRVPQSEFDPKSCRGAACADFDNDGDLDLFVTDFSSPAFVYENQGGMSFSGPGRSIGATGNIGGSWGDFDNDGQLDIFVSDQTGGSAALYHNGGGGQFERTLLSGSSFSGAWADYDSDGDLDLFVARVAPPYSEAKDDLYENLGDGTLNKVTAGPIPAAPAAITFGGSWADYDNDADLDLFVARLGLNSLYENDGNGTFVEVASDVFTSNAGSSGAAWGDFDNDGFIDLYVVNNEDSQQNNELYRNLGGGSLKQTVSGSPANDLGGSRMACWVDYNNDGFLDLFVTNGQHGGARGDHVNQLYRNNLASLTENHWIRIDCVGTSSNRDGIGAKVRVRAIYAGEERWQMREITGGSGWGCSYPLEAHFGLGDAELIDTVRVEWPSGQVQELESVAVDQILMITEEPLGPILLVPTVVGPDQFQFTLSGAAGHTYRLESSQDLENWAAVGDPVPLGDPAEHVFPLTVDKGVTGQYYRVVEE